MAERTEFRDRLQRLLTAYGPPEQDLLRWFEAKVDFDKRTLHRWLCGMALPTDANLRRLMAVLGRRATRTGAFDADAYDREMCEIEKLLSEERRRRTAGRRDRDGSDNHCTQPRSNL